MNERQLLSGPGITRRHALRLGMAVGAGLALGMRGLQPVMADGTPRSSAGYAHPEALVTADWLQEQRDASGLVLVGFMPPEDFEAAHIPGSVQVNAPALEVIDTSDASIERWHQATQELLGSLGISRDSMVVAYDAGTLFSARLWWILHYFGHEDVHILDGGLPAWEAAGGEVESGTMASNGGRGIADSMMMVAGGASFTSHAMPYEGTPNPDMLAQMDEVMASVDDPDVVILDARTLEEYAEGHIPGAVNLNFPLNAVPEAPKVFRPADELRALYDDVGATAGKHIVPYCASGVRSAVTTFALHLIGHDDVALYTGSWLEWGENPDTPKATGEEP